MAELFITLKNNKMKNIYKSISVVLIATFAFTSCEKNTDYENEKPSISMLAVSNANFSILASAAVLGGAAGILSNPNPDNNQGNYTVFAPNNAAFGKLGLTAENLAVLNRQFLTNTLFYATSNGNTLSQSIVANSFSPSKFNSIDRKFINRNGQLYINGSKILNTNIAASNGTVHEIDKVLLASGGDIVQSAIAVQSGGVFVNPDLTFLVESVLYAELAGALSASQGSPSFTVFAPNDAAFKKLGTALGLTFTNPVDIRQLPKATVAAVLLNHVVVDGGKFTSELNGGTISSLGANLTLGDYSNGVLTVKGNGNATPAQMTIPDIKATNGVIHIIDTVILN